MKERLINRAVDLWQKYGYENVSVNMISKTCGVTKGSFYHHFSSKEEVIDSYIDIRVKNVLKEIDQNASYADILFSIIQKMTEPIMELNEDLIFIVMRQRNAGSSENDYNDVFVGSEIYNEMKKYYLLGQKSGEIRNDVSAEELLNACNSVFTGNIIKWCLCKKSFDLLEEDRKIMELIIKR